MPDPSSQPEPPPARKVAPATPPPVANSAANPVANPVARPGGEPAMVVELPPPEAAPPTPVPERRPWIGRETLQMFGAWSGSMIVHCVVLIALALWMLPEVARVVLPQLESRIIEPIDEEELTVELDERVDASITIASAASAAGLGAADSSDFKLDRPPEIDASVAERAVTTGPIVALDVEMGLPERERLIDEVPEGTLGDFRAVVDDYQEAMDRITQEILLLMSRQKVLVVWCFDQSDSMKDDQQEIRDRIERVYTELGLTGKTAGDSLTTGIVSYGSGFRIHTELPTSDVVRIRRAIDEVPNDPSGKEMMCQAIVATLAQYKDYARKTRRRTALVLVTDESGDPEGNLEFLEPAIAAAKDARATIYVLGREAVFGYPYVHISWHHPQTRVHHWLPIHRGPETAFVEQLQTNGFHRRHDAFPSGFGPYEQSRLATETGGIFFMLPSVESNLVRGEKRRYELEAMRSYRPDLRARHEVVQDRDLSELRRGVYQIIGDLNPYRPEVAKVINMQVHFSRDVPTFVRQVTTAKRKIPPYVVYLDRAASGIESLQHLRDREASPRWQANIDLLHAQLLAYKARIYEYGAYLDAFVKNPKPAALTKPPDRHLRWDIRVRKETLTGDQIASTVEQSRALFQKVIDEHPGTPWAARAKWEIGRGFGVELVPTYHQPARRVTGKLVPIPKL